MSDICNVCDGTGCCPFGPPPGETKSFTCSACGGSGEYKSATEGNDEYDYEEYDRRFGKEET